MSTYPVQEQARPARKLFKPKSHIETVNDNYVVLGASDEVSKIISEAHARPGTVAVFTVRHLWIRDRVVISPKDVTSIRPH